MTAQPRPGGIVGPGDVAVIGGQLGREPRDLTGVAVRCPFGYPAVIETAPVLTGGAPNPTLLYLTCPTLVTAVSRAEAEGAVRKLKAAARADAGLRRVLDGVTESYQKRRTELASATTEASRGEARLEAGIGGPEGPEVASCLHAYAAALLAVMSGWLPAGPSDGAGPADGAGPSRGAGPSGGAGRSGGRHAVPSVGDGRESSNGADGTLPEGASGAASVAGEAPPESAPPAPGCAPEAGMLGEVWARFLPPVHRCWCTDARCGRWELGERRAVIDVGTISVRLLVADIAGGRPRTVVRRTQVTRLGEGLRPGGDLAREARRRTSEVVACFVREARGLGARALILAGTSATRESADGEEFVQALGRENEIEAVVLSGRREAELAYAGAALDIPGDSMVLLDVGGGSTELIFRPEGGEVQAVSLPLGAGRATDRWIKSDPPTRGQLARIREEATRAFAGLAHRYDAVVMDRPAAGRPLRRRLVGVAGTVTTLACLDAGLEEYSSDLLHLRELSMAGVGALVERLSALTTAERAALPCVQAGRAPVIVGGAVIVLAAMETLGYESLTVSERDLLDGLALCWVQTPV